MAFCLGTTLVYEGMGWVDRGLQKAVAIKPVVWTEDNNVMKQPFESPDPYYAKRDLREKKIPLIF